MGGGGGGGVYTPIIKVVQVSILKKMHKLILTQPLIKLYKLKTKSTTARLFHRLKIGRFSGSLAELFLAPPIAALSVESRSVPAVVSTSRLLLIFNLWAAECTRCFLYFK